MAKELSKRIDLRPLKEFVIAELSPSSELRVIILEEKDTISSRSFVTKLGVWKKLMREEQRRNE